MAVKWDREEYVGDGDFAVRLAKHLHRNKVSKVVAAARAADYYKVPRKMMGEVLGSAWRCEHA